jgi:uncharacterized protein
MLSENCWKEKPEKYDAQMERKKGIEKMTIDIVQPGEIQSESDHDFQEANTRVGSFKNRQYRDFRRGGWFSLDMNVSIEQAMALVVEYGTGAMRALSAFDIIIDGENIATDVVINDNGGQYYHVQYDIPDELTLKTRKDTIKFESQEGNGVGPVIGIRTMRR